MEISEKGIELIKKYESYRSNAYKCPAGYWTIAWGNRFYSDGTSVKEGDFIYTKDAKQLFSNILYQYGLKISELVIRELKQYQFDALVSFIYSIGVDDFKKSTILKKINQNPNDPTIIDEFRKWNIRNGVVSKGLTRRRNEEAYLYNNNKL